MPLNINALSQYSFTPSLRRVGPSPNTAKSGASEMLEKTVFKRLSYDEAARETNVSSHSLDTDDTSGNKKNAVEIREARFKNASPAARTVSTWPKTSGW